MDGDYAVPTTPTSGVAVGNMRTFKKRLSDGSTKSYSYPYSSVRKHFELTFTTDSDKLKFEQKCEDIRLALGVKSLREVLVKVIMDVDTNKLSSATQHPQQTLTMSSVTEEVSESTSLTDPASVTAAISAAPATALETAHENFVGQCSSIAQLIDTISQHSSTCVTPYSVKSWTHSGHVLSVDMECAKKHSLQWSSSSTIDSERKEFEVNHRVMLSYLASGMTPIQYERFSDFSRFGLLSDLFRRRNMVTFSAISENLRKQSIFGARAQESSLSPDGAISIMTDARHHCRRNSYHTDHVAIGLKTHKVVDIQHINGNDDNCSQRHEAVGFDRMYESLDLSNIKVAHHVHDRNMTINKRLRERKQARNSNDRWHCTRPITAGVKKIGQGAQKNIGKTWHPELSDKGAAIRNHVYWCMDNCNGDAQTLRKLIESCIPHFQNNHSKCHETSHCKEPGHMIEVRIVSNEAAITMLQDFLRSLVVYKHAEDYVKGHDTFYVESFNNVCLIYLDKRIHYGNLMYELRSNLAVLDWNEHVDRPYTSICTTVRSKNPRRQIGKKVYRRKTYVFVENIWNLYIAVWSASKAISESVTETSADKETCQSEISSDESDDDQLGDSESFSNESNAPYTVE